VALGVEEHDALLHRVEDQPGGAPSLLRDLRPTTELVAVAFVASRFIASPSSLPTGDHPPAEPDGEAAGRNDDEQRVHRGQV
jgi:hypothetical protein